MKMTLAPEREQLITLMEQTVNAQERIGNWVYAFWRPQNVRYTIQQLLTARVAVDCSDGVRSLCYAVGVKDDPAGNGYQDYGNSSSIYFHLRHIDISEVEPGDIFTFGRWSGEHHACMAYRKGASGWDVWNHGRPGDPHIGTLLQEIQGHAGMTVTACRINVPPDPPPTPEDVLRAKTGFYAWVAWRLGEGPWKKYGKLNPKVRPNVPTVIPPRWWRDLLLFLRARKRGNPNKEKK